MAAPRVGSTAVGGERQAPASSRLKYWRSKVARLSKAVDSRNEAYDSWEKRVLIPWQKGLASAGRLVYTSADSAHDGGADDMPGMYPFTRGIYPNMYAGKPWTMRMFSGFGIPEDTNSRLKYLLKHGETGLSIAFDEPTLYGVDCDSERAEGEIGKCGVNVTTLKDMEVIFDGIPLDKVSTSMTINAPAIILFAMYIAVAQKRGINQSRLAGTLQADILKEYIAQKEWFYPPKAHLRMIRDMMLYSVNNMPKWNFISVSGYHIREAGSTAAQELAFTLADGFHYVDMGIAAGLKVDDFAPRISFFFDSSMDMFEEIAKFRAARRIWATVMRELYGAKDERSLKLRFHAQTSGYTLTWQQPLNNIARTALEALYAVLGGAQSLHTNSYDEALALPTEAAAKVALRTQQVIAEETGIKDVADPMGGSYYLEYLTNRIELEAYRYFEKLDERGGILKAVEDGYPQREIADASYQRQRRIEAGEAVMVGVNKYQEEDEAPINILKISRKAELAQKRRLADVKRSRDEAEVSRALDRLREAMRSETANLVPHVIDAVKAYATIGEIVKVGRDVYGEWKEPRII